MQAVGIVVSAEYCPIAALLGDSIDDSSVIGGCTSPPSRLALATLDVDLHCRAAIDAEAVTSPRPSKRVCRGLETPSSPQLSQMALLLNSDIGPCDGVLKTLFSKAAPPPLPPIQIKLGAQPSPSGSRKDKPQRCSRCGGLGHKARTCKHSSSGVTAGV